MEPSSWVTAGATIVLAVVTIVYVVLTARISRASRDSADAARDSAEAARESAEQARRAADTAESAVTIAAEQHRDDQLRHLVLSFDVATQQLVLRNHSTRAAWENVSVELVNAAQGPVIGLEEAPPGDVPTDQQWQLPNRVDLAAVVPGDVRRLNIQRASDRRGGELLALATCSRDHSSWRRLLECKIPLPPPELWGAPG